MSKKICGYCGAANDGKNKYCAFCGAPMKERDETGPQERNFSYYDPDYNPDEAPYDDYRPGSAQQERVIYTSVEQRSVALSIVLTLVTFGLYGLYWMYKLNNEVNELAEDPIAPGGGMVIFLWIVTFGIYGLFWYYKMGQKCDEIRQVNASSGILYLILACLCLGIVSNALIQDTINKVLE